MWAHHTPVLDHQTLVLDHDGLVALTITKLIAGWDITTLIAG